MAWHRKEPGPFVPQHLWKWIRRLSGGEQLQLGLVKGCLPPRTQTAQLRCLGDRLSRQPGRGSTSSAPGSSSCLSRCPSVLEGRSTHRHSRAVRLGLVAWHPPIFLEVRVRDVPAFSPGLNFQAWSKVPAPSFKSGKSFWPSGSPF